MKPTTHCILMKQRAPWKDNCGADAAVLRVERKSCGLEEVESVEFQMSDGTSGFGREAEAEAEGVDSSSDGLGMAWKCLVRSTSHRTVGLKLRTRRSRSSINSIPLLGMPLSPAHSWSSELR